MLKLKLFFYRKILKIPFFGYEYKKLLGSIDWIHFTILLDEHRRKLEKLLGVEIAIDTNVLMRAMPRKFENGWFYCPCRFEKSWRTLCPCIWHVKEIVEKGRCRCRLFYKVSKRATL